MPPSSSSVNRRIPEMLAKPAVPTMLVHGSPSLSTPTLDVKETRLTQLTEREVGRAQEMSTKEVLERHLKCLAAGDLAGFLADYAPDAVVFRPVGFAGAGGVAKGLAEFGPVFSALFKEFARPGTRFEMRQQAVEGDYAYIIWEAETADNIYAPGSDTYVIKDGKIIFQSFAGKIVPK
jgi:ketosteroid isomerase-like protein